MQCAAKGIARSPVLARERVPLGLTCCRQRTLGLLAVPWTTSARVGEYARYAKHLNDTSPIPFNSPRIYSVIRLLSSSIVVGIRELSVVRVKCNNLAHVPEHARVVP